MSVPEIRLFARRWDMHALQALSARDHVTLRRVFTELGSQIPADAVDTQVGTFGFGAPMQFCSYGRHVRTIGSDDTFRTNAVPVMCCLGFFDKAGRSMMPGSKALFDRSVRGDTLLHLALRHIDPQSALVLVQMNASLTIANSIGESPLVMVFAAFALFKLRERDNSLLPPDTDDATTSRVQSQSKHYTQLFSALEEQLSSHHASVVSTARETLMKIYSEHAPERVPKIDTQLHEFEYREQKLLDGVRAKYLS